MNDCYIDMYTTILIESLYSPEMFIKNNNTDSENTNTCLCGKMYKLLFY